MKGRTGAGNIPQLDLGNLEAHTDERAKMWANSDHQGPSTPEYHQASRHLHHPPEQRCQTLSLKDRCHQSRAAETRGHRVNRASLTKPSAKPKHWKKGGDTTALTCPLYSPLTRCNPSVSKTVVGNVLDVNHIKRGCGVHRYLHAGADEGRCVSRLTTSIRWTITSHLRSPATPRPPIAEHRLKYYINEQPRELRTRHSR